MSTGRLIGNRGASWRGLVTPHGSVVPSDGGRELQWFVAADDRWYEPAKESTTRQKWYSGYPVCETRVKIPGGDMIQRVYAVADLGGLTVMEFENDSPMPVVVAVTRNDVLTTREPHNNPALGIDLPSESIVVPVGHKGSTRVALAHHRPEAGRLPEDVANHQQVVRGWESACDAASRLNLADHTIVAGICRLRSDVLLGVGIDESNAVDRVRMGDRHHDSILEIVDVVQSRLKREKKSKVLSWDTPHLLSTAAHAAVLLDEDMTATDIARAWLRIADRAVEEPPATMPEGHDAVAWAESLIVAGSPSGGQCTVLPHGIPEPWWGASFDVRGVVADPHRRLSYAVRWHGERPALLWELDGPPGLVLTHRQWHDTSVAGETLLPSPRRTDDPAAV